MNHPMGSKWRKWDLHFHTPASFDYQSDSLAPETIVDKLLDSGIAAVAITDHHNIDIELIRTMSRYAEDRLTIFPGIELRSEYGGKPVHYIGLFPEDSNLVDLWDMLKGRLGLTPTQLKEKGGDESVYVSLEEAHDLIVKEVGGLISIHAGAKSNSIEEIRNAEQFQQRLKLDITREYVDLLEVGQLKDVLDYIDIVFPSTGLDLPLLIGSDNHNITEYAAPPCWIKADTTFYGLRQVLNEPDGRVFLGDRPPQLRAVDEDPTRFIESIRMDKKPTSELGEIWFDGQEICFNQGLVAVVGNQGSGKSAFTDVLGLLGKCPHTDSFAFLNSDQFLNPKLEKGSHFRATLTWTNGDTDGENLAASVSEGAHETIKYIPQFHLDEICDELRGGHGGKFEEELKTVIFSRIPPEEKTQSEGLDELISFRTRDARDTIDSVRKDITKAAQTFRDLEAKAKPSYRTNLEEQLAVIKKQIAAHEESEPKKVKPPGDQEDKDQSWLRDAVESIDEEIESLEERVTETRENLTEANRQMQIAEQVRGSLENFQADVNRLQRKIEEDLKDIRLEFSDLVTVRVDLSALAEMDDNVSERREALRTQIAEEGEASLLLQLGRLRKKREELQETLSRPAREYAAYQEAHKQWTKRRTDLIGDEDSPDTKVYLENRLAELDELPGKIDEVVEKLRKYAREILTAKNKLLRVSEELYEPVRDFIVNHPIAGEQFGLDFFVSFVPRNFETRFLNILNQARRGSFYGDADGKARVRAAVRSADFSGTDGVLAFLDGVFHDLTHDVRRDGEDVFVSDQLRQDYDVTEMLAYVFGLDYLEPQFELRWHGRPLDQLSPGERGTLLLIFFLLIDDAQVPLVIDQPEGNLDNQTVYELLVDCIKDAKKRRQIVIVTHNPNLAVVCDAEQVVLAKLDKADRCRLTYRSGSLENPEIGNRIVDILEGTRPAIENRMAKYRIIFD